MNLNQYLQYSVRSLLLPSSLFLVVGVSSAACNDDFNQPETNPDAYRPTSSKPTYQPTPSPVLPPSYQPIPVPEIPKPTLDSERFPTRRFVASQILNEGDRLYAVRQEFASTFESLEIIPLGNRSEPNPVDGKSSGILMKAERLSNLQKISDGHYIVVSLSGSINRDGSIRLEVKQIGISYNQELDRWTRDQNSQRPQIFRIGSTEVLESPSFAEGTPATEIRIALKDVYESYYLPQATNLRPNLFLSPQGHLILSVDLGTEAYDLNLTSGNVRPLRSLDPRLSARDRLIDCGPSDTGHIVATSSLKGSQIQYKHLPFDERLGLRSLSLMAAVDQDSAQLQACRVLGNTLIEVYKIDRSFRLVRRIFTTTNPEDFGNTNNLSSALQRTLRVDDSGSVDAIDVSNERDIFSVRGRDSFYQARSGSQTHFRAFVQVYDIDSLAQLHNLRIDNKRSSEIVSIYMDSFWNRISIAGANNAPATHDFARGSDAVFATSSRNDLHLTYYYYNTLNSSVLKGEEK